MIVTNAQTVTSWAKMAPLGDDFAARKDASMASYNGELYILGGYDNAGGGKDFAKYNPVTKQLTKLKSFDYRISNPLGQGLFEVNGKLYLANEGDIKIYDIAGGNWQSLSILNSTGFGRSGGGFVIGTTIYFIDEHSTMIAYDTVTNTAVKKADKPVTNLRGFFCIQYCRQRIYGFWKNLSNKQLL